MGTYKLKSNLTMRNGDVLILTVNGKEVGLLFSNYSMGGGEDIRPKVLQ